MATPVPPERPRETTSDKKAPANDRPKPDERNKDTKKARKDARAHDRDACILG